MFVRDAFNAAGHEAWSCDVLDAPGYHIYDDVANWLTDGRWDLMIAHPPCTRLAVSGALRFKGREAEQEKALEFVRLLMAAPIKRKCIENPISVISTRIRRPDQIIQPYQFGEDASRKTCLWLEGLKPLAIDPALYVSPRLVSKNGDGLPPFLPRWANQTDSGQNRLAPSEHRAADRARTYQGIADAFVRNWGAL